MAKRATDKRRQQPREEKKTHKKTDSRSEKTHSHNKTKRNEMKKSTHPKERKITSRDRKLKMYFCYLVIDISFSHSRTKCTMRMKMCVQFYEMYVLKFVTQSK